MDESEQKYRHLFENASDAIWVQDIDGIFVDGNRAWEKLTGLSVADFKGAHLGRFLSKESLGLAREVHDKLIRGEPFEQPYEQQFCVKGGSLKTENMSTSAIISDGKITGFEHMARDVKQEKQQQERVRAYIQQITRAQEEERKRISRDLHDDVSPELIILIQKLDKLAAAPRLKLATVKETIADIRAQAVQALESLRTTAQNLRPRIIDDLGLVAAIEWIAEELERDENIRATVESRNLEPPLPPETQMLLFRIAQEALNNIRKHARASKVLIKLEGSEKSIKMTVTDNGQGFEVPKKIEDIMMAGRLGLMGMYERAGLLNGKLKIQSSPGEGTQITITLPRPARH